MRFFKNVRTTDMAEDEAVVARLNGIATRCRAEASLYQGVEQARKSKDAQRRFRDARKAPQ